VIRDVPCSAGRNLLVKFHEYRFGLEVSPEISRKSYSSKSLGSFLEAL
jgi:hypothetical protein